MDEYVIIPIFNACYEIVGYECVETGVNYMDYESYNF